MLERPITFFFRGGQQQVENIVPTMTVLQFLREYTQTALLHKDLKCKAPLIEPNLRRNLDKWST